MNKCHTSLTQATTSSAVSFAGSNAALEMPAGVGSVGREGWDGVGRRIVGGEDAGLLATGDGTDRTVGEGTVFTGDASCCFGAVGVGRISAGTADLLGGGKEGGDGVDRGKDGGFLGCARPEGPGRACVRDAGCSRCDVRGWSSGPAVVLLSTSPSYVGESTPSSASPSEIA